MNNIKERLRYGGFWKRSVAVNTDQIAIWLITTPILSLFGDDSQISLFSTLYDALFVTHTAINLSMFSSIQPVLWTNIIVQWLYYAGLTASPWRGTLGKRMLGLRVVNQYGGRIDFITSTFRWLCTVALAPGFVCVLFSAKKRALHDMIVGTYVIYSEPDPAQDLLQKS